MLKQNRLVTQRGFDLFAILIERRAVLGQKTARRTHRFLKRRRQFVEPRRGDNRHEPY